jgi:hypothetical protein
MDTETERASPPAVFTQVVFHRDVKRKLGAEAKLAGKTETAYLHQLLCRSLGLDAIVDDSPKTTRPA